MTRKSHEMLRPIKVMAWTAGAIVALVMNGCGPIGNDDSDQPTVTTEQTTEGVSGTPETSQNPDLEATPEFNGVKPINAQRAGQTDATPSISGGDATPASGSESRPQGSVNQGTTIGEATPESGAGMGDGTSGAALGPDGGVASQASSGATTSASTPDSGQPIRVSSCTLDSVPKFTGESNAFVVTEDVNFRSGPGTDCAPTGEASLTAGIPMTVISDPVVRDDQGDVLWVLVDVGGQQGWVAAEFIEPAP